MTNLLPTSPPHLPDDRPFWTPADIATVFSITDRAVRYHCRRLFGHRGRYRFTLQEARHICAYIHKFGLKDRHNQKQDQRQNQQSQSSNESG